MARIVILEKGIESRVEVIAARTRAADSPYYAINPSGRVPYLVRDDGVGMEESALICDYLDGLDGKPAFDPGNSLEARRLEALARSLLDGLSVWNREISRPENERSPTVIRHEAGRATPWRVTDAPDDFVEAMLSGIVGLEIPITRLEGKWKMSQNRNAADRAGVVQGLRGESEPARLAVADIVARRAADAGRGGPEANRS